MAFLPAILPYVAAGASAAGAIKQSQASTYNAKVDQGEANLSVDQANAQEGLVRRQGREALGRQAAAFGAAGVGYGGSSETALDQSSINSEMDALNTRYKGAITGYGYDAEAGIQKSQANQYGLMAGAALLKGFGSNYNYTSGMPQQPSTAQANPALGPVG
jgi:hypothetical protein